MSVLANTIIYSNVNAGYNAFANAINNGVLYMFAGKSTPWSNDLVPDNMDASVHLNQYQLYDEMIFGKLVSQSDFLPMVNYYPWVAGDTTICQYDDQDPLLYTKKYFVMTHENGYYNVFKCLNNNSNTASLYQPKLSETSESDEYYSTADGYQWKFMYGVPDSTYTKFATSSYFPLTPSANVAKYASNGSIDVIEIVNPGSNYVAISNGYFTSIGIGGNAQLYAIQSAGTLVVNFPYSNTLFSAGETVSQANNIANTSVTIGGTTTTTYATSTATVVSGNNTALVLTNISGSFNTNTLLVGATSHANVTPSAIIASSISPNTDFYTGSSIYIDSGTGAGQVRNIARYIVTGTQNRVLTDIAFSPQPDVSSHYIIAPRVVITGDGANASAVAFVNVVTNSLQSIKMISKGSNYSYANVAVIGNTGSSSQYLNIGITSTVGNFQVGETVTESYTGATGQVVTVNSTIMSLTNINGVLAGNSSVSTNTNFTSGSIVVGGSSGAIANVYTVGTSSANCRAIISPFGGHGSNPNYELNANKVGVSVTFSNTESGTITVDNEYRRVGLLANPLVANVILTISSNTFQVGETITQTASTNTAYQIFIAKLKTYTYNIAKYSTVQLTTSPAANVGDVVFQLLPISANGVVVSNTVGSNSLIIRTDTGGFSNGATIYDYTTGNTVYTIGATGVGPANTTSITGLDASNNSFTYNTNTYTIDVRLNTIPLPTIGSLPLSSSTITGTFTGNTTSNVVTSTTSVFANTFVGYNLYYTANGTLLGQVQSVTNATSLVLTANAPYLFTANALNAVIPNSTTPAYSVSNTTLTIYNHPLVAGDTVIANVYIQTSGVSTNSYAKATATVTASNSSSVTLTNVNGFFVTGQTIIGSNSGYSANVTTIYGQPTPTFDQRTRLACTYLSGSKIFAQNDYVQQGYIGLGGAFGTIQAIDAVPTSFGNGTITTNTSSALVTGINSAFNTTLANGSVLYVGSNNALIGVVATGGVTNATSVTLTANALVTVASNTWIYANTGGNFTVSLTGVKGIFQSSDLQGISPQYISSADGTKTMKVLGVIQPSLIPYTGQIVYAENLEPITRASNQSETIKIVVAFP